ncbi:MAG: hypothetical protein BWK75_06795 [Candidatus Altiarchaeales archaeon A3]|nr:MAG: hypothetical protein BWK75_06795 [Candidatus Altiarchaeales archaeon A3]
MGSHPYDIVFSWHKHGIHLYYPYEHNPNYFLRATNYAYAKDFIKMAENLINEWVAFVADDLEDVLNFLSREKYWTVNDYDELHFDYIPSKEYKDKYLKHIKWDELKIVKFL